jgi:hypothetical protein
MKELTQQLTKTAVGYNSLTVPTSGCSRISDCYAREKAVKKLTLFG